MANDRSTTAGDPFRDRLAAATDPAILRPAVVVGLILTVLLTAITHADALFAGRVAEILAGGVALAFLLCWAGSTTVLAAAGSWRATETTAGTDLAGTANPEADFGPAEEMILLEHHVETINRFPDENPNPVLRMTDEGHLIYANPASEGIRTALGTRVGQMLPERFLGDLRAALANPEHPVVELEADRKTYAVLPVAVPEFGFVNLYGTDITASKVINKFPDANPNPVIRVTEDGRLLYANKASTQLTWALGCSLGEKLPDDAFSQILHSLDEDDPAPIEVVSQNRTYALKAIRIPEFDFINVYGTDITAAKGITKFPDQNPNPVLRITREGKLLYANQASRPLVGAHGWNLGDTVPADLLGTILDHVDRESGEKIEMAADDQLFAILPVWVPEFGFINMYGTDITAARMVEKANADNERLLLNILPGPIADRLRQGEKIIADRFDEVTLLFADIVDFTALSSRLSATEVIYILNGVFSVFDEFVDTFKLEKIKTIGDAYMVVGGLPDQPPDHCARVADMALALCDEMSRIQAQSPYNIQFRIGIHTGPAVAGVIGVKKFIYDVWGDTVNTASRMESHGIPGRVQVTHAVYERLRDRYVFEPRGIIDVRGKGPMETYFLQGKAESVAAATVAAADAVGAIDAAEASA